MNKLIDISGKRFGHWTVLALDSERHGQGAFWLCRCDCPDGTERIVRGAALRNGTSTSCGCKRRGWTQRVPDLTGQRFGRWLVLSKDPERYRRDKTVFVRWLCRCCCDDRTERPVIGADLRSGKSTNCGCVRREKNRKRLTKHGLSHTQIYWIWQAMLDRCRNPNNPQYADYGGRGIAACEYYHDFMNWHADTGDRPSDGLTLDRIDNDRGYEPGNIRWADHHVQRVNQRPRRKVKISQTSPPSDLDEDVPW